MKTTNNKIGVFPRIILLISSLALVAVLFVPLWRIYLSAPQYPEGLSLRIYPGKLAGDVDIINGLNHYIGMKTLHSGDFMEFTILPYLIAFFALMFLLAFIMRKRKYLLIACISYVVFGIIAMVDFWRWEYNYGHHLDPEAAIKVPGMTYQPPLIGYKQLLNFSAYSVPDIGGWIFLGVGLLALVVVIITWRLNKKIRPVQKIPAIAVVSSLLFFISCNQSPEPIKIGRDNCSFCKMGITDARFGAEILTKKGKSFKFDDAHCLVSFLKSMNEKDVSHIYITDFAKSHKLIDVKKSLLFKSEDLHSPMGGNVAAFDNADSLKKLSAQFQGSQVTWEELKGK